MLGVTRDWIDRVQRQIERQIDAACATWRRRTYGGDAHMRRKTCIHLNVHIQECTCMTCIHLNVHIKDIHSSQRAHIRHTFISTCTCRIFMTACVTWPTRVGSGAHGSRNPRTRSPWVRDSQSSEPTVFLEFHFPGLCWHTVLGFWCSRSFSATHARSSQTST